jgi:hypothetical protein
MKRRLWIHRCGSKHPLTENELASAGRQLSLARRDSDRRFFRAVHAGARAGLASEQQASDLGTGSRFVVACAAVPVDETDHRRLQS